MGGLLDLALAGIAWHTVAPGHLFALGMNLAMVEKCSTIVGICGLLIAEYFYNYSIKRRMDLYNYRAFFCITQLMPASNQATAEPKYLKKQVVITQ